MELKLDKTTKILLGAIALGLFLNASNVFIDKAYALDHVQYEVNCNGYDSDTGEYVYGTCRSGEFEGYDSDTDVYVYGDCQIGGSLDAYNSDTGEYVYGDCE